MSANKDKKGDEEDRNKKRNRVRLFSDVAKEIFDAEKVMTVTAADQIETEMTVLKMFKEFEKAASLDPELPLLDRKAHCKLLMEMLHELPVGYECLEASRPWLVYWILNSLWILNAMPCQASKDAVVDFLSRCQHEDGGYGGGPGQMPHLAPTYAAINALSIIGSDAAYNSIDRSGLQSFLWSVRNVDGAFAMHKGGEYDIRGAYCALSVARITNVYSEALFDKTAEWVVSCQTYEGGFGGYPGMEAHGGYAFCGLAGLSLLGKTALCDTDALLRWCVNRQMRLEGGFQGRTNKLVDGCYSFWQGADFPIIAAILSHEDPSKRLEYMDNMMFDQAALQEYILICCQSPNGGLRDKPGKPRDAYHTCYTLGGLSLAQHGTGLTDPFIVGSPRNEVNQIHPIYNIAPHFVYNASHYFIRHPPPVKDKM